VSPPREPAPGTGGGASAARRSSPLPPALVERISREATPPSDAILVAAAELFTERGIANVSLRAIAERAQVNYNYIHRHFGTKEALLVQLVRHWTRYGAAFVDGSDDITAAVVTLFQADPGRFAEILAHVALDGTAPGVVFDDTTTVRRLRELLEREWASPAPGAPGAPGGAGVFDARVVTAVVTLLILTWDFYAPYMLALAELDDRSPGDVHDEVLGVLTRLIRATAPPRAGDAVG
jgi:AcrR family transcriptional regulator